MRMEKKYLFIVFWSSKRNIRAINASTTWYFSYWTITIGLIGVASSVVEHPAFNRLVLSSNLRRPILIFLFKTFGKSSEVIKTSEILKNYFFLALITCSCASVNAGLNKFTDLIFVEEWLIERKVDLTLNETKCRASIPLHANWFGGRIRLGPNNELIKPIWISVKADQVLDSKLANIRELLDNCRSGLLFLPENL